MTQMKKSIKFKEQKLVDSIKRGDKTQTVRIIKSKPLDSDKFIQRELDLHKYHKAKNYSSYPILENLIKRSKYQIGDTLTIEDTDIEILITSISFSKMLELDNSQLQKEGLDRTSNPFGGFFYYDYLERKYACKSRYESFAQLMLVCYGVSAIARNPIVFVYEFKIVE